MAYNYIDVAKTKDAYLAKLAQIETQEIQVVYVNDFQTMEDLGWNYQLWDGVLNEVYGVLKTTLSESQMNDLKKYNVNGLQIEMRQHRKATIQKVEDHIQESSK